MNKRKKVVYGDRIYARLCQNGQEIVKFMMERVSDLTEVIGEIRHYTRKYRGLCRLYIRNVTRGWAIERPLMLYPDSYHTVHGWVEHKATAEQTPAPAAAPVQMHIPFPWETH